MANYCLCLISLCRSSIRGTRLPTGVFLSSKHTVVIMYTFPACCVRPPSRVPEKKKHTLRSCTSKWSQRVTFLSCAQFRPVVMWNSLVTAVSLAWRLRIHMLCRDIAEFSLSAVPRDIQVILRTLMYYDAPEQSFFFFLSFPTFGLAS